MVTCQNKQQHEGVTKPWLQILQFVEVVDSRNWQDSSLNTDSHINCRSYNHTKLQRIWAVFLKADLGFCACVNQLV